MKRAIEKAPQVAAGGALNKKHSKPQFSEKCTTAEAQRERIVRILRMHPHTSYEMHQSGAYQCPTRVFGLRQRGWAIVISRVVVIDAGGYEHQFVALYELISEPERFTSMNAVDNKQFTTLVAQFEHALIRSRPGKAPATFCAARRGMIKPPLSLDVAGAFLQQSGGTK